jgi:hypothetical protein
MGSFISALIPVDSIDLENYTALPLGSAGEAFMWLSSLIERGSGSVGFVKRDAAIIGALKRALLKYDGVAFEVAEYETRKEKVTRDGKTKTVTVRVKDADGKPIKTYEPPANRKLGYVFAEHHKNGASVHIDRLDGNEAVSADSREVVRVTVQ